MRLTSRDETGGSSRAAGAGLCLSIVHPAEPARWLHSWVCATGGKWRVGEAELTVGMLNQLHVIVAWQLSTGYMGSCSLSSSDWPCGASVGRGRRATFYVFSTSASDRRAGAWFV
jgi:hypothetical protein